MILTILNFFSFPTLLDSGFSGAKKNVTLMFISEHLYWVRNAPFLLWFTEPKIHTHSPSILIFKMTSFQNVIINFIFRVKNKRNLASN